MLFAHLKRILKLDRLRLRGPCGARDEFHLAAAAQTRHADPAIRANPGHVSRDPSSGIITARPLLSPSRQKQTSSTQSADSGRSRDERTARSDEPHGLAIRHCGGTTRPGDEPTGRGVYPQADWRRFLAKKKGRSGLIESTAIAMISGENV
jgi:hypothetical protein